ncbi:MAG: glycosyltransferase [Anaerolineae bacterium]|nr:glycosyltransferase [Anaerolineae bacterium]
MKKHVLVISFDFPPQGGTGAIRVTKFAKYLPEFGWQPVVVASDALWNPDDSLARDVPDVPVYRVGWPRWVSRLQPNRSTPSVRAEVTTAQTARISQFRSWLLSIVRHILVPDVNVLWVGGAQRVCEQVLQTYPCDAVLTTSPPHSVHLVGYRLHKHLGIPWIADFRDVWTAENLALRRMGKVHFMRQQRIERRILAACDHAIMVTEPLAQQTQICFGPLVASKCSTITNGFDLDDFVSSPSTLANDRFVMTYVGTVLGPRTNNLLPEGLRLALAQSEVFRQKVLFRFIGKLDPTYRMRLTGLEDNIDIVDMVAHDKAIAMMRAAHLLLLLLPNDNEGRMSFTNKFFEYLAARRPILALVPPGLVSDIVVQEQIGIVAMPDNAPAIAQALLTMFETVQIQPDGYCPSGALLARFDRRILTQNLAEILSKVA